LLFRDPLATAGRLRDLDPPVAEYFDYWIPDTFQPENLPPTRVVIATGSLRAELHKVTRHDTGGEEVFVGVRPREFIHQRGESQRYRCSDQS
jgi:hypothetical protein